MNDPTEAPQGPTTATPEAPPDRPSPEDREAQRSRLREPKGRSRAAVDENAEPDELVRAAATGRKLSDEQAQSATDWLLSDSAADAPTGQRTFDLDVGTDDEPIIIEWTIRAIDGDELRNIDRAANDPRQLRRGGGEPDRQESHARTVVVATIDPDIKAIAKEKGARDPVRFLIQRFAHKPGIITQLAGEVMNLSGFDINVVREAGGSKTP